MWHKIINFVKIGSLMQMNKQQIHIEGLLEFCEREFKGN